MFILSKVHPSLLLMVYLSTIIGACAKPPKAAAPPPIPVKIGQVASAKIADSSEYVVNLQSVNIANIRPRVSGYLTKVHIRVGDVVQKDQPLFEIDPSKQQAVLDGKVSSIGTAQANLESSRAVLQSQLAERQRIVAELEYNSQQAKLQDSQAQLNTQKSEYERIKAEKELNSYQSKLDDALANLRSAKAQRDKTKAELDYQKVEYERNKKLYEEGVYSRESFDQATRNLQTREATLRSDEELVQASQAKAQTAQRDLERFEKTITAQLSSQTQVIESKSALVESSTKDLERTISSLKAQLDSQDKVIEAQRETISSLQDQVRTAQANAVQEQVQLQYYQVTAPFSGKVGELLVKVGDSVEPQTLLTTISQGQVLEVSISIPIERLSRIRVGTPVVLLDSQGKEIDRTVISYISPQVGDKTQTILVKAIYDNATNKLRTEQQIRARVIWEQQAGLTVPFTAVKRIGSQNFVFVVETKSIEGKSVSVVEQRPVELGALQGNNYAILKGLEGREDIVTSGIVKLRNGATIIDLDQVPKSSPKTEP